MPNQAASYRLITDVHDAASVQVLTRRIDDTLRSQNFLVQNVQSGGILREKATQALNILVTFLLIMAVLTAFVGSIGLMGTMSINVLERTREIGVMRTIGAIDRVIMLSVIIEALVIGLIMGRAMSGPVRRLAVTAAEMAGRDAAKVIGVPDALMQRRVPRLKYSVLAMEALQRGGFSLPRPWQESLADYVRTMKL